MKKHNLHTHSSFSDGTLSIVKLIEIAEREQFEILGISDHLFKPKIQSLSSYDLPYYLKAIREQESRCRVLAGLEIDCTSPNHPDLPVHVLKQFDYLLFENAEGFEENRISLKNIARLRVRLNLPCGLAHEDLQAHYPKREQEVVQFLADNDIFLDLNEFYRRHRNFSPQLLELLARYQVKVAIGTDFHSGNSFGDVSQAQEFVQANNLKYIDLML